jgi:O-antigen/teichoic acid export membrane protein
VDASLYGAWLASGNVVAYLGLFDLGMADALKQRVAFTYGKQDFHMLSQAIWTGLATILALSLVATILGILFAGSVGLVLRVGSEQQGVLTDSLKIVVAAAGLSIAASGMQAVLAGLHRPLIAGSAGLVATFAGIAITIILLEEGYGLLSIAIGVFLRAGVTFLATIIGVAVIVSRTLPKNGAKVSRFELRATLRASSWSFASNIAFVASTQSDALIVATILSPLDATRYVLTKRAAEMVQMICFRIPAATLPSIAHLAGSGDTASLARLSRSVVATTAALGALGLGGVIALNKTFVSAWVGLAFFAGDAVSLLAALAGFLGTFCAALNSNIYAAGNVKQAALLSILDAAARLSLSVLFGRAFGLNGLASAAVVTLTVLSCPWNLRAYGAVMPGPRRELLKGILKSILAVAGPVAVAAMIARKLPRQDWTSFLTLGAAYGLTAFTLLWFAGGDCRGLLRRALPQRLFRHRSP